jgi:Ser-tRNA(Ala) deacylase AlaX
MLTQRTRKLFWENPFLSRARAQVVHVDGSEVRLDRTIVFSFSGGQESDDATLNDTPVVRSRIQEHDIYYMLSPVTPHNLHVGDDVVMQINWERRNRLMRYHMLCELVLVLFNRYFGEFEESRELEPHHIDNSGILKVMARMTETSAYVDFDHDNLTTVLPSIQAELDRIIAANLTIETGYLDEESEQRYWKIAGLATVPCGGTHVRSTGEIGPAVLNRERTGSKVTSTRKAERIKIRLKNPAPSVEAYVE